jgi:glyoxylase-like metal-dependent hydrolase (beta-lactamase superfamily II)
MGDVTLELYSMGGMHTDSDIAVFVPEEGLVAVGDVMPERWLPRIRKDIAQDFPDTLQNWGRIVDGSRQINHVNMAHSDMVLSVETFQKQYAYLQAIWQGLREMQEDGLSLEDARARYSVKEDFPYFYDERSTARRDAIHINNIEVFWDLLKGR